MALNLINCKVGTVVDHFWEYIEEDQKEVPRDPIRRGIVVKVNGSDSGVESLLVQFGAGDKPVKVLPRELNVKYPATSRVAREALRRVLGEKANVGAVFAQRKANRPAKVVDALLLTQKPGTGVVLPEEGTEEEGSLLGPVDKA